MGVRPSIVRRVLTRKKSIRFHEVSEDSDGMRGRTVDTRYTDSDDPLSRVLAVEGFSFAEGFE